MKTFLLLLVLGYASSDKLDLTYLPPPGSQHAGGRPEDIQIPLEFPKETYSTTLRPHGSFIEQGAIPDDHLATIGMKRIPPSLNDGITGSELPNNNFQNLPMTTVSYAFTQTTTHPPIEGFETTIAPFNPVTGLPVTTAFNDFSSQAPNLAYNGNINGHLGLSGLQPTINQYGQPTVYSTPGSLTQFPQLSAIQQQQPTGQAFFGQNRPGQQPDNYYETQQIDNQSGNGNTGFGLQPPFGHNRFTNNTFISNNGFQQPGLASSTFAPQDISSTSGPDSSNAYHEENIPGYVNSAPNVPQNIFSNQNHPPGSRLPSGQIPEFANQNQDISDQLASQEYPGYPTNTIGQPALGHSQSVYHPSSTAAPSLSTTGYTQKQFASDAPGIPDKFSSVYPGPEQGNIKGVKYGNRPERPQAESDRNAVILNYDNIITPDGYFAYSYDTSNGIHADESGTANDGVKAKGSYSYTGDDGKLYTVVYTADENGFQPQGDHLPTPPPIPEAIQKIIDKVKQEKEAGISHDGSYDNSKYGHQKYPGANGGISLEDQSEDNISTYENQPALRKPTSSAKRPIYGNGYEAQDDNENYQTAEDKVKGTQPSPYKSSRPGNRITTTGGDLSSIGPNENGFYNHLLKKGSSRLPSKGPIGFEKQSNNIPSYKEKEEENEGIRRRPGSNSSVSKYNQPQNEQDTDSNDYDDDTSNNHNRRPNDPSSPAYQQEDQEEPRQTENNNGYDRTRRPLVNKSVKRPVSNVGPNRQTAFKQEERISQQPKSRLPPRRPTNQPINVETDNDYRQVPEDREVVGTNRNRYITENTDLEYPSEEGDNDYTSEITSFENGQPQRVRPNNINKPATKTGLSSFDQNISTRRRPTRPDLKVNAQVDNEYNTYPKDDLNADRDTTEIDATSPKKYGGKRPTLISERFDQTSDKFLPEQENRRVVSKRPQLKVNTGPRGRPYVSAQDDIETLEDERVTKPSSKYGQKIILRPSSNQQTGIMQANDFDAPLNDTGYDYIPPQIKFNQDEVNKYSTKFPGTGITSTTKQPSQRPYYVNNGSTAKPFLTPNVSRGDKNTSEEEYDDEETIDSTGKMPPRMQQKYNIYKSQKHPETGFNAGRQPSDQGDFAPIAPSQPITIGSTYRPIHQQNTGRPNYTQTPGFETTHQGTSKPYHASNRQDYNKNQNKNRTPYETISSTTPMPSYKPYYGSTESTVAPGQVYYDNEDRRDQNKPGNGFTSSTTSLPSQRPSDGYYPQNINSQYQTTYRPMETVKPTSQYYEGTTRLPNVRPTDSGISSQAPYSTKYGSNLPSTTYRPNYKLRSNNQPSTARPGVQVDGFGRPVSQDAVNQQYSEFPSGYGGENLPDGLNSGVQYPQNVPGSARPGTVQQQGDRVFIQPSTERIIGEDFSGPKQPQSFDPETGYHY